MTKIVGNGVDDKLDCLVHLPFNANVMAVRRSLYPSAHNKCACLSMLISSKRIQQLHITSETRYSFPAFKNTAEILQYVKQSSAAVFGAEKMAGKSGKLSSHRVLSSFAGCTSSAVLVPFLSNRIGGTSRRCTVLSAKTCHKVQLNPTAIISVIPNMAFRERRRHTKIFQICMYAWISSSIIQPVHHWDRGLF